MFQRTRPASFSCVRCPRALEHHGNSAWRCKSFTTTATLPLAPTSVPHRQDAQPSEGDKEEKGNGAMSRRLSEMSEANLEEGGRSARKAVEEAGFDDELKQRLLNRIADASFQSENARAISQVSMPSSAGQGTRDIAAAEAWSGTESVEDASLRMLNDARKPIRRTAKIPSPFRPPKKVDTGRPRKAQSSGTRLANARDRSSIYSHMRDGAQSDKERDEFRKAMKEKFSPGARPMPTSFQGLASLANERIEDAIARGQFKNLPRGKKIEHDYNASSPFLDTTEYFMNKIIQKQEIVPPWIEKQQELVSTASKFRSRLRSDWRRHAARMISSQGGTLESKIRRAEEFAAAEAVVNPPARKEEKLNSVDNEGHMSQITLTGQLRAPENGDSEASIKISVTENEVKEPIAHEHNSTAKSRAAEPRPPVVEPGENKTPDVGGMVITFRDPRWEETERAYHKAAIENLNSLTRSYNLMAPNLAKKPYFSLDRELRSCYADVAPQIPSEIHNRANAPKVKVEVVGHAPGGVLEKFGGGTAAVYDERRPQYGFKEFWKDLFGSKEAQ